MRNAAIDYLRDNATLEQDGYAVRLPPEQLERAFYEQVDDVLVRLGGKWNGRKRLHLFPYDVTPAYQAVLKTGILPPKNPTAFFPTPAVLVADMVRLAELHEGLLVLEPSAGTGAVADAVRETGATVHCCEVLDLNRAALESKGHELVGEDFMAYQPGAIYDAVLMNPPFSLDGDKLAYIAHINHAWTLLKEGGVLIAITPTGFEHREDRKTVAFRDWLCEVGEWSKNGAGLFKESGTGIDTCLVYARKEAQGWRQEPYLGWPTWHAWATGLWIDHDAEYAQRAARIIESGADPVKFAALVAEVVKVARKSQEPLNPSPADIEHIRQHMIGDTEVETAVISPPVAEAAPPPPPKPTKPARKPPEPPSFGPLFS